MGREFQEFIGICELGWQAKDISFYKHSIKLVDDLSPFPLLSLMSRFHFVLQLCFCRFIVVHVGQKRNSIQSQSIVLHDFLLEAVMDSKIYIVRFKTHPRISHEPLSTFQVVPFVLERKVRQPDALRGPMFSRTGFPLHSRQEKLRSLRKWSF